MGYAHSFVNPIVGSVNPGSNVAAIDDAARRRGKSRAASQGAAADAPPPPTLEKVFADAMMKQGGWAASNPSEGTNAEGSSGVMVYKWNGLHWQHIGGQAGLTLTTKWLDCNKPNKATVAIAKGLWEWLSLRLRDENKLPTLPEDVAIVPCADAYLEISREGIRSIAPDPALGLTYATRISCGTPHGSLHATTGFNPKSKFGAWICHALPDERMRDMVQEQCGVCLLPGVYSQAAWWWGVAGSGKSTLADMVGEVLSSVAGVQLENLNGQFGLEPVVGAQLIKVEEVEFGAKWDEGKFKPLVSGNGIYVNRKHEKAIGSYKSKAKWIITSNPEPFIRDKSDGVMRRLGIIHWAHPIEGDQDPDFVKKVLAAEGRQFLDWMLEGALRVIRRGRMMNEKELPEAALQLRESVRRNSDSVRDWVMEENVRRVAGKWRPTSEILYHFNKWCEANFRPNLGENGATALVRGLAQISQVRLGKRSNRRVKEGQAWGYELDWTPMLAEDDPRRKEAPQPETAPEAPSPPRTMVLTMEEITKGDFLAKFPSLKGEASEEVA